jgi:tetratricopeptide (TPR) repeat protein
MTGLAVAAPFGETPPAPLEAKRAAQAHLDRGNELFTHDDFQGALTEFEAAFALYPSPKLQLNLGQCERALGHGAAARAHFQRFLDDAGDVSPALRAEAERYLAEERTDEDATPATPTAAQLAPPAPEPAPSPIAPLPLAPAVPGAAVPMPQASLVAPPATAARPVYRRWWFWAAAGVVAAGAALAIFELTRPADPCDKLAGGCF